MQPHTLLMAKLALVLLATGGAFAQLGRPFAPLIDGVEGLQDVVWLAPALKILFGVAGLSLLLNRFVRLAAGLLGLLGLYSLASASPGYGIHLAVAAVVLILCALHAPREQPWLIRVFVISTLAMMALAKILTPEWMAGDIVRAWMEAGLAHPLATWLQTVMPGAWVPQAIALFMVAAEVSLAVTLVVPRTRRVALWALGAYLLATGLLVASPETGALAIALAIGSVSFIDWPKGSISVLWPRACGYPLWLRIALDRYDCDVRLDWPLPPDPDAFLEVDISGRHYEGSRALSVVLLHFPAFLASAFALVWVAHLAVPTPIAAVIHAMLIGPVLALFALPRVKRTTRRLQRVAG